MTWKVEQTRRFARTYKKLHDNIVEDVDEADRVVQIYGGAGYLAEYEAERFFRDARIYRIYEGTTQILQLQIAKHMLREWAEVNG